ncbi:hypothetical protein [Patulibacter sp.]|uniref:hypothetical protein n=1 Tax=Patulibacter sp. TaxID=1912859 RepID=UPI0027227B25|nr:hypothetical protein [Patulibacter sp.]MDO9408236.1 hypothetical protein [Patulibacter sp.]
MRTTAIRRRSALATAVAVAAIAGAAGPSTASAASYRSCSPSSVKPLQKYAASFATAEVKGVTCKSAVRLVRSALAKAFADETSGTPEVAGYRCRLSGSSDASNGADPFVRYTCSKGTRRIRYTLVS